MNQPTQHLYEFGPFRLDAQERLLQRDGATISLTPKAFDLLLALIERHGRLVEKEELLRLVWPDAFVEEANLTYNISFIRKALGEGENGLKFIETVPKHGYRFVAEVRKTDTETQGHGDAGQEIAPLRSRIAFSPRWFLVMIAPLLVLALAVYYFWSNRTVTPVTPASIKSIAVLPFKPLNAESHDEALELGLADTLITKLGGLRQLIVRPMSAVRKYTNVEQDPLAAGREQDVDAVLESHLQRYGDKVRISARLLNRADGKTLREFECVETYCADFFLMQDTIAEKIATALKIDLTADDRKQLRKRYTENRAAYDFFTRGRYFREKMTSESVKLAEEYYQKTLDLDPTYALVWVELADIYFRGRGSNLPERELMARSKAAAEKALALDETLGEAHTMRARILWKQDLNWAEAKREFERALELEPNSAPAHQYYGNYLSSLGQHQKAIAQLQLAQRIDPLSPYVTYGLGTVLYFAGESDQALAQLRKVQELDPPFGSANDLIGMVYAQKGMYAEAVTELESKLPLSPRTKHLLAYCYAMWGKKDMALRILDEVKILAEQGRILPFEMAEFYTALGEKDKAFEWLRRSCLERDRFTCYLKVDPKLKPLHADPRFAEMIRCVGLPQ